MVATRMGAASPAAGGAEGAAVQRPVTGTWLQGWRGWGLAVLLLFDVCFFLWWRPWAWGNHLFKGPHGLVEIHDLHPQPWALVSIRRFGKALRPRHPVRLVSRTGSAHGS